MIPKEENLSANDVIDHNCMHGVKLMRVRFGNDSAWLERSFAWRANHDEEITEMEFDDGSVWRVNRNHTPPRMSHLAIRA